MTPELKAKFEDAFAKTIAKYKSSESGEFADEIFDLVKQEFPECKIECSSGRYDSKLKFKMIATRAVKILLRWYGDFSDGIWKWQVFTFDPNTLSYRRVYNRSSGFACILTEFPYDVLKKELGDAIRNRVDETGDIVPKILKYVKKRLKLETSYRKSGSFKYVIKVQEKDVHIQQVNDKIAIGSAFYYSGFEESESIEIADPKSMNRIVEKVVDTVRQWNKNSIISINNDILELQKKKMELQNRQIELQDCVLPELDEEEEK